MLKQKQKKDEGKIYLDKINQFGNYVKNTFMPKVNQKKKEELKKAIKDKHCSFSRYDGHLPSEAMLINEKNYPISPKYLKEKTEA